MECLDANAVQDLMSGALDDGARASVAGHLDDCDDCRSLLAQLGREAARDAAISTLRAGTTDVGLIETAYDDGAANRDQPVPAGRPFGRYLILERLGAGAMGVVYRAEDPELGRNVALKLLHRPDAAFTERLVREARAMAQVNHPNVVAVYDVGVVDGSTYIAMELVQGTSLREWQRTPRTVPEIALAYVAAGRGLAAAHAAGIVHRDFKPDNCLVGADTRVRVTDFGLSAARPGDSGSGERRAGSAKEIELTTAGSVIGTPAYMAPEQFLDGNVDSRTDQFNFCVALYEALYGFRPFDGKTFAELGDNVCDGKVRAVPKTTRVSRAILAIVLRGLSVMPGDRFPTMEHLLADLGRDRARPWRRTSIVAAVVAGVLALGMVTDFVIRSRVSSEIHQSFAATGVQVDRAFGQLTSQFDINANQVYALNVMREVAGHRDQADFELGDVATDDADLADIHEKLRSQDWKWVRQLGRKRYDSVIAVGDYKGRMLYTSADEDRWRKTDDLTRLPWIKRAMFGSRLAIDADMNAIVLVRADDPHLATSGLLGTRPPFGLVFVFVRALVLNKELRGLLVQALEAVRQIDEIRLDKTAISLVALDRTAVGDLSPGLVAQLPDSDAIVERRDRGISYQLQSIPIKGFANGEVIGHVVLAREMTDLISLFPGARLVFTGAMFGALALAIFTKLRARQIAEARA